MSNKLIQALEPRLMLDGAAVATAIDAVDDLAQFQKSDNDKSSKADHFKVDKDIKLPFVNVDASSQNAKSRQIVFIDSTVEDIETLINSFDKNTEVHVIQSDQDGFVTMQNILSSQENIDAVHIIGHGSVGQIAFGTAVLNNDTLNTYENILQEIGTSLSENGDILFYGCNVAADQSGEILIKQIADITDADVAASDDITGKGGDWDLEKHTGIIETENVSVVGYQYALSNGVTATQNAVELHTSGMNFMAGGGNYNNNTGGQTDSGGTRYIVTLERGNVTTGSNLVFDYAVASSSHDPDNDGAVNVYMVFLNDYVNRRSLNDRGIITFDNEILGIFTTPENTIAKSGYDMSDGIYPLTTGSKKVQMRDLEYLVDGSPPGTMGSQDAFTVTGSNKILTMATDNGLKGDFVRVVTRVASDPVVGNNDSGYINENLTLGVSNGASANDSTPDTSGEHTGDVLLNDTGGDGSDLIVSAINGGSLGSPVDGTYGQLTLYSNGSYSYSANKDAANELNASDTETDTFTYTVSDGSDTATATITITVAGVNDAPVGAADTGYIKEDGTLSVSNGGSAVTGTDSNNNNESGDTTGDVLLNDTDPDASASLVVSAVQGQASNVDSNVTGTYGTLNLDANGSYTYIANQSAADGLAAGATATDTFSYTVSDGTATSTVNLVITVIGVGPEAVADTASVNENVLLNANNASSTGLLANDDDNAAYDSESLAVTNVSSNSTGNSGSATQGVLGTYGTLTVAADGTYTYTPNTAAAEALDANDPATDVFTYTVKDDDDKNSSTATLTISITGQDDNPVAVSDTGYINEDGTLTVSDGGSAVTGTDSNNNNESGDTTGDVLLNDTDADASADLVVSAIQGGSLGSGVNGTYGTLTLYSTGRYTYVADKSGADGLAAGAVQTDVFTYTVSDGAGDTSNATLTITVKGIGPQGVADTASVAENATVTNNNAATNGVLANDDDNASFDQESLAVTAITGASAGTVGGDTTGTHGTLSMNENGTYSYAATNDALDPNEQVTDVFTYTVKDDDNKNSSTATLTITVTGANDPITAVADTDAVTAGSTINRSESSTEELDHDDTDPDGDDVSGSFTITNIRHGSDDYNPGQEITTSKGRLTVDANGSYTYVADQSGSTGLSNGAQATDVFTYTVRDHSGGDTDTATLTITITGSNNNPPVADADGNAGTGYILEDQTLTVTNGSTGVTGSDGNNNNESGDNTGDVLNNDTDADGHTLTVSDISGGSVGPSGATGTYGTLTIQSDGSYTYNANNANSIAKDATATDVFTYTVDDDNGGTDTATITFTILGVNDAPSASNDTNAVDEDATASKTAGTGVLSNDSDADTGSSMTVTAITGASSGSVNGTTDGTYGTLTLNDDGSYSYTANKAAADALAHNATANDVFTYTVTDNEGATATATLTITVTGKGPVGSADSASVNENVEVSKNADSGVLANDTGGDQESLAVTNISSNDTSNTGTAGQGVLGTYGTLTINADGSYSYTPNTAAAEALDKDDVVTEVFTYTVKDDDDKNSSTATLTFTITGVNDAIVAVDDTDSVDEDGTVTRLISDDQELDHDDTDVDTDDVSGSLTITDIRTGPKDGTGTDGTVGVALTGEFGTLTVNADGSYTYVADQDKSDQLTTGQTGTDTFTYTVSDGDDTSTAEISFTVTGINDNDPVAADDTDTVNRDATIDRTNGSAFDLAIDDTDADNDTLTITEIRKGNNKGGGDAGTIGQPLVGEYGTLTLQADGSYKYVADQDSINNLGRGQSVIEHFNYTVSDGSRTSTGLLSITVNGISDPPVPEDDTLDIDAGAQTEKGANQGVLINDTDPDGDPLSVDSIRTGQENETGTPGTIGTALPGTYGDLTMNSDGSYIYQANNAKALNPGETATEYFTYTATDGESSVEAQIAITVTGKNDPPEVLYPVRDPNVVTGEKFIIKHKQIFDDPDTGIYDIAEYKIIDPEDGTEVSLPDGLRLKQNKIHGSISTPGTYSITIRAIDGAGLYADHTFTITVKPAPGYIVEKETTDEEVSSTYETVVIKPKKDYLAAINEIVNDGSLGITDEGFNLDTISIADTASLSKPLKFNGGLRLMDAVANETSGNEESDLSVGVKLNDDNQKNVELYSGKLSDGEALPEWIQVNPETGETTANMPEGVEEVEVQLVALDKDGNTRDINIVLDKAKIKNDQDFTRGLVGETRVAVDNDANVNLIRKTDGKTNQVASNNLNAETDFLGTMKLSDIQVDAGKYTLDVIDDNQSNVKLYKAEMKDGSSLPAWITIDPETGAISADPSIGRTGSAAPAFLTNSLQVLELKIIAEDEDGKERIIEVDINLDEIATPPETEEQAEETDEVSFIPLDEQLKVQSQKIDNYGEKIISLVS
ncbi:Ig-like domain-containing protein [Pelagibacteraceae bacterium]|nr:Ig-like domain-containing protein [Pelagibacteraceae bacterium]